MAEHQREGQFVGLQLPQRGLELIAGFARDQRHEELRRRVAHQQQLGGLDEGLGHVLQLGLATARQQRKHRPVGRHAEAFAHGALVDLQRHHVGERVADIAARDRGAGVQLGLEGIDGEDVRDRLHDLLQALAPPGPDRGADELDGGDARALEALFQPEIEVGPIDANEGVGLVLAQTPQQLPADARDPAIVAQHFGVAANGEFFRRPEHLEAFALHLRPADAVELDIGQMRLQRGDQMGSELVAGGFAGDHGNAYLAHFLLITG